MTVYWETSQRPLIIKTVWIKGHRHAILSEKDDLNKSQKKKFQCTLTSDRSEQPISENDTNKNRKGKRISPIQNYTNEENYKNKTKSVNLESNSLSERVLQWLDLAGLSCVKYSDDRLMKIRHSLPDVKITQQEIKMFKKDIEFNDDKENPVKVSENHFKNDKTAQIDDTLKNSDKSETHSIYTDESFYDSDEDDEDLDDEHINEKNESYTFQNDYMNIIKKQIFENHCNVYAARKKLHIFIPSLPKKPDSSIGNDSATSGYSVKKTV